MTAKGDRSRLIPRRRGEAKPVPRAEWPLPREMKALDEAEAELAAGKTRTLDEVLRRLGPRG
jgi:hypothetical protein